MNLICKLYKFQGFLLQCSADKLQNIIRFIAINKKPVKMSQQFLPLLKPQNIEQLKNLILQIMVDNDNKLQKTIENHQNQAVERGEQFTLDNLNDIVTQQCLQKQKTITNLSHFALSLMNTINILWQDNQDLEYKIKDLNELVAQMNQNIHEFTKQNEYLKNKLQASFNDFHKLQEQKQAVQSYFNSLIAKYQQLQYKRYDQFSQNLRSKSCQNLFSFQQQILNEEKLQVQKKFKKKLFHSDDQQQCTNNNNFEASISLIKKHQNNQKVYQNQCHLLQQSIIKDSISVLRRFTLEDQIDKKQDIKLIQSKEQPQFIDKAKDQSKQIQKCDYQSKLVQKCKNFSLINEVSIQVYEGHKEDSILQLKTHLSTQKENKQIIVSKQLRISNQKVNITIATGTQFTKEADNSNCSHVRPSILHQSPSCGSFILNRHNSSIMYPSFERSNSSLSFACQSTKHIQANFDQIVKATKKDFKKAQKKSIGIDTQEQKRLQKQKSQLKKQAQALQKQQRQKQKTLQDSNSKSFTQLIGYFTKRIVSDRIKATNKKNEIGGFKKSKTNILKMG